MKESTKRILEESGFNGFYINDEIEIEEVEKLTRDMKKKLIEIGKLDREDIKSLVNLYYDMQDVRKKFTERLRSTDFSNKGDNKDVTDMFFNWVLKNMATIEKGVLTTLEAACNSSEVGRWLMKITGIGPVLAAGLLAYFDVEGKEYASQFISYAGLNDNNRPWLGRARSTEIVDEVIGDSKVITKDHVMHIAAMTQWRYSHIRDIAFNEDTGKWNKNDIIKACSMIPYNAGLKTLMWKVGKSFVWMSGKPDSVYGRLYAERKALEIRKNENGELEDAAASVLASKNFRKTTDAYKAYVNGKLPPAHIAARAMRWTEKIFISHLFEEMYRVKNNRLPARYYPLATSEAHNKNIEPEIPYYEVPAV